MKIFTFLNKLRIEPFLFLVMFSLMVKEVSQQSLIMDKVCRLQFNQPKKICDNLVKHESLLESVQKVSTHYKIGHGLITIVPSIVTATLLSPWSDKYGRKLPMLASIFGLILEAVGLIIIGAIPSIPSYFLFIAGIPTGVSGGYLMAISSTYTYLADVTDRESRAIRYAILEVVMILATPLGMEIGGQIYKSSGITDVYAAALVALLGSFIWVFFFVEETRGKEEKATLKEMIRYVFRLDNLKESLHTCIVSRPGTIRAQIWLSILATTISMFCVLGSLTIGYFYANKMYKWTNDTYSTVTAIAKILHGLALSIVVPIFTKILNMPEGIIGLLGVLSYLGEYVIKSVAYYELVYYYAYVVGLLGGISGVAVRSILSKVVNQQEISKVFTLLALSESLTPVFSTIIFNEVYAQTLSTFPGASFVIMANFMLIPLGIFIWISRQPPLPLTRDINVGNYRMESFTENN